MIHRSSKIITLINTQQGSTSCYRSTLEIHPYNVHLYLK